MRHLISGTQDVPPFSREAIVVCDKNGSIAWVINAYKKQESSMYNFRLSVVPNIQGWMFGTKQTERSAPPAFALFGAPLRRNARSGRAQTR